MDGTTTVLPDALESIFNFLASEDLWTCLSVSRLWRQVANSNSFWKKHCRRLGVYASINFPVGESALCPWALTYYYCHQTPRRKWKTGTFETYSILLEDKDNFLDYWEERRGLVYYFLSDKLFYYEIEIYGIKTDQLNCFGGLPSEKHTVSFALNRDFIVISRFNVIIVFKRVNKFFEKYKYINFIDSDLNKVRFIYDLDDFNNDIFHTDSILHIKFISEEMLWVSDNCRNQVFVINLKLDKVKHLPGRTVKPCFPSVFVPAFDDNIVNIYNIDGTEKLCLDVNIWEHCVVCNHSTVAVGNQENQRIEAWDLFTKTKLMSKSVLYQTDIILHPYKDLIILNEKTRDINRFTCINSRTGDIVWRFVESVDKKSRMLKIVSLYLLVVYSHMDRLMFCLRRISDGLLVTEALVPQERDKPFAQSVTSLLWIYIENDSIKIRSYM